MALSAVDDQNYEDWMSTLSPKLLDIPLYNLAIPGSHDAMSYCLDITSPLVRSESDSFRLVDKFFYCLTRPIIYRWATTQERDVVEQLKEGIRYFDLRIASKQQQDPFDKLYFTHVIYTSSTVLETLEKIAAWLDSHPKEVVILACSHFEGLSEERHERFIFNLKRIFGQKLCPRTGSDLTLRGLWGSRYQVVLSYDDDAVASHLELWPGIPYWWANKRTAPEVVSYLDQQKEKGRPEEFFVAGLNLTAERRYMALHSSLRKLTLENEACLMDWLQLQSPGTRSDSLNVVAGDFVGTVPFCGLVIALNEKLARTACAEPVP
ncbi:PI-PLC X domain-containing protein 1-like [Anguilla anguilla]|uniref:PI-PLC X domain-containing protein 1-like n=1 Tax=Anguilla anguilla TaxID=7936 RepID=UPI0015AB81F9|nr:PI-PLC X domain-containing protein 1-like [Anguilla anguilla]XP_035249961.1 PI-PLC X domain-containing protein 1-like [Anguilla anguilla]